MKIYTIIGGMDGVGKSSFTGVLKSQTTDLGTIVDVDKITAQMGGKSLEGGKWAIRVIESYIKDGVSFTQETTLSGHRGSCSGASETSLTTNEGTANHRIAISYTRRA